MHKFLTLFLHVFDIFDKCVFVNKKIYFGNGIKTFFNAFCECVSWGNAEFL